MKFIIGKKQEMTQKFLEDGTVIPVTRVIAGPCLVIQKKNIEKDGYSAIQLGWQEVSEKKLNKPMGEFFKKIFKKAKGYKYLKEFRLGEGDPVFDKLEVGQKIDVSIFKTGDKVSVQGLTKGKGFQGVVKRHGFSGGKKSHGHKDQLRMTGSIGAKGPARVFKGQKMPGQMGNQKLTIANLEVVEVNPEIHEILIKGGVPGAKNSLLFIKSQGEFEIKRS